MWQFLANIIQAAGAGILAFFALAAIIIGWLVSRLFGDKDSVWVRLTVMIFLVLSVGAVPILIKPSPNTTPAPSPTETPILTPTPRLILKSTPMPSASPTSSTIPSPISQAAPKPRANGKSNFSPKKSKSLIHSAPMLKIKNAEGLSHPLHTSKPSLSSNIALKKKSDDVINMTNFPLYNPIDKIKYHKSCIHPKEHFLSGLWSLDETEILFSDNQSYLTKKAQDKLCGLAHSYNTKNDWEFTILTHRIDGENTDFNKRIKIIVNFMTNSGIPIGHIKQQIRPIVAGNGFADKSYKNTVSISAKPVRIYF